MMEIFIERIWEAGIRLARTMGAMIGIVGAVILGQAAVEGNLMNRTLLSTCVCRSYLREWAAVFGCSLSINVAFSNYTFH